MAYYNQPNYVGYGTGPNQGVGYNPMPAAQPNIQNANCIISVNSREEAMYFPVGPGNSVIMRNGDDIYIKTASYSTTEKPIFEVFTKEQPKEEGNKEDPYKAEFEKIWDEINELKSRPKPQNYKRREDGGDRNV